MGDKTYKFEPSNMNLIEYLALRGHMSRTKRNQANDLKLEADAIDEELAELQRYLKETK